MEHLTDFNLSKEFNAYNEYGTCCMESIYTCIYSNEIITGMNMSLNIL